jgi:hypothetical protein
LIWPGYAAGPQDDQYTPPQESKHIYAEHRSNYTGPGVEATVGVADQPIWGPAEKKRGQSLFSGHSSLNMDFIKGTAPFSCLTGLALINRGLAT